MNSTGSFDLSLRHNTARSPWRAFARYSMYAFVIMIILVLGNVLTGEFQFHTFNGFALVGVCVAVWWWIGEAIWHSTVAPLFENPSLAVQYVTLLPLWFMSSGIGYTLGLLMVKRLDLFYVYDIPVEPIFLFGGIFGAGMQGVFHFVSYRRKRTVAIRHAP